jgi:putative transposase
MLEVRLPGLMMVVVKLSVPTNKYSIATFKSGKIYNCDLSAAANIAARYWAYKLKLTCRKDGQLPRGKNPSGKSRMPITLSNLWDREADYVRPAS